MDPTLTALNIANSLANKALDKLGIVSELTRGEILKRDLGLENFDFVYIQKILSVNPSVYVVTMDSRYPHRYIPRSKLMNLKSSEFTKLKTVRKNEFKFSELKFTPPFDLDQVSPSINSGSLIALRDLAGEYFSSGNIAKEINESINKYNTCVL